MKKIKQNIKSSEERIHETHLTWEGTKSDTECEKFKRFVQNKYKLNFESDKEFHQWSVEKLEHYWEAVWEYFDIIASKPYEKVFVKTGPGFLDNDWFSGATFNYAENLMRIRDDSIALMYEDEEGNTGKMTFATLYEEVKRYAAAFRKHGLTKGDLIVCYMSNRMEAIIAMLASLSIGAIWGAVIPYLGAHAAAKMVSRMEPKFMIISDRYQNDGKEVNNLTNIPIIIEGCLTLKKVIIVETKDESSQQDISHIKHSCFLPEFLESGKLTDGTIPDLVFEQLPSNHPVFLSFTSGTSGMAKGFVHSAWVLMHSLTPKYFTVNMKRGNVMFCNFPMGWIILTNNASALALGITLFLYDGDFGFDKDGRNVWNIIWDSKASVLFKVPSDLDLLEKSKMVMNSGSKLEHLKVVAFGSCPVKNKNIEQFLQYLPKDTFVGNVYGATEFFGCATSFYLKSPAYKAEMQLPMLGIDLRCYNDEGQAVIGEIGNVVIAKAGPFLPSFLWKDLNNREMYSTYLSQFPGVWCQNDVCWINSVTLGIHVKGRKDDIFNPTGERFTAEDIYFAIHEMEEIDDSICVAQTSVDGHQRVVLFIKMKNGYEFTPDFKNKVEHKIENELYYDCVPQVILETKGIPYNVNNKKLESVIRKILVTNQVPETIKEMNIKNPDCLKYYCDIPEICDYSDQ